MAESWVINASPVILLAKVGLIVHVPQLTESIIIPEPVAEEIRKCRTVDAAVSWINGTGRQFVRAAVEELAVLRETGIGPGERSVISWAAKNPGFVAVLDDSEARAAAQRFGVRVRGTVGVVLEMKKRGLIPEVNAPLTQIRRVGGYMSDELFREALHCAGERSE